MKLILELEVETPKFKPEATEGQILKYWQRKINNINQLIINKMLDDSDFSRDDPNHPMAKLNADLKVISYQE